jgi:epoxyqueuosine reductase
LVCPWNKFAQRSPLPDVDERPGVHAQPLAVLLGWSEAVFLHRTEGSPIRRIGHVRWLRNLAVAAGNALRVQGAGACSPQEAQALRRGLVSWQSHPSAVVQEHVAWALNV